MQALNYPTLILNKNWDPVRIRPFRTCLKKIFIGHAVIVNASWESFTWDEWLDQPIKEDDLFIVTTGQKIKLPRIVRLTTYNKVHRSEVKLTKKNLITRDNNRCAYTGNILKGKDATTDHVVPLSRGGKNTWDNVVLADRTVNRKKGNKLNSEANLTLKQHPFKPQWNPLYSACLTEDKIAPEWGAFFDLNKIKINPFLKSR